MAEPTAADGGPLILLDGMSLAFRAYFALPPDLTTSTGVVTNAVHGFASLEAAGGFGMPRSVDESFAWALDAYVASLSATTPVNAAGCRIEPPVSLPSDAGVMRAATAPALPPDDPPGARASSHGFLVGPKALCSVEEPMANSSMLVLPGRSASAAASRATTVASYGGR